MVAFELSSTMAAQKFISLLKVVKGAASLGSSHSLVCQPAKLTHVMCTQEVINFPLTEQKFSLSFQERDEAGVTDGLLRLSVGLENVRDIIDDIKYALEKCTSVQFKYIFQAKTFIKTIIFLLFLCYYIYPLETFIIYECEDCWVGINITEIIS